MLIETRRRFAGLIALALMTAIPVAYAQDFDIVIEKGRVMDPETGLDAVRYPISI